MSDEPLTITLAPREVLPRALPEVEGAFATVAPGRYVVEDELARGSYGRVMRAQDLELRRTVALKELLPEAGHARARFEREALLAARLQHPSIIPVYATGCWPDGTPFIAMKLVTGATLAARLASLATTAERVALAPVVVAVAEAIAYAHGQRVVHRDLKPANILVGEFGEVVVIDWGLAAELDSAHPVTTPAGTPGYLAPEQAAGAPPDERTDVFALGAILHHLLTGEPPVPARSLREAATVAPRALPDDVPAELRAITTRAMARDPAARYPTARELAADLVRFQTGQLVSVHTYSLWALLRRFVRRNRAAVAIASILLAVLAVGGAVSIQRIRDARGEALDNAALARDEADRANAEASRASAALAKFKAEERARREAEAHGAVTEAARAEAENQVQLSREQLVQQNARLKAALRDTESAKARAELASQDAAHSAAATEQINAELTRALDRERAHVKELETKRKSLATELP